MNTPILPGYWRAMAAGWNPNPPGSSNNPNPPGSTNNPSPPGSSDNPNPPNSSNNPNPPNTSNNPNPPAAAKPAVGNGADGAWLLAEALRTTRSRIVKPQAPEAAYAEEGRVRPDQDAALWRWQRPFREAAILTELMGVFVVDGLQLWWLPGMKELGEGEVPSLLFDLQKPPDTFDWSDQIDKVLRAADERQDRMAEVLSQQFDISPFFDALTGIDQSATRRLCEALTVAANLATQVVMSLKHTAAVWRPCQRSARVQPMIATPGHGSLPSGHATVAAMNATLLSALLYEDGDRRIDQLDLLARRIAFNRVVAGVHFPVDSMAGYELGRQLAASLLAAAGFSPRPAASGFAVQANDTQLRERPQAAPAAAARAKGAARRPVRRAPLFRALWLATQAEVQLLRV